MPLCASATFLNRGTTAGKDEGVKQRGCSQWNDGMVLAVERWDGAGPKVRWGWHLLGTEDEEGNLDTRGG
ncbi:UNVERIFIED_CONTAM: hypothetical protein Sradi_3855100 [Sesamum radiatum]|uniref:Uncharacterized protein n=1 Tax=Sesamum radiatum TaxID=300843 RepID=A0AAW2Q1M2_SESRA